MNELKVYLTRDGIGDLEAALVNPTNPDSVLAQLQEIGLAPNTELEGGKLLWGTQKTKTPAWMGFLNEIAAEPLEGGAGESRAGILALPRAGRIFIFTFGQAWHAIDPSAIEDQFGIRVALNTLDMDRVKTVDTRTLSAFPLHTTRQLSRAGPIDEFRIGFLDEFVNLVQAIPASGDFGDLVTGRDSLVLKKTVTPAELPQLCDILWDAFNDTRYREIWPLLERLRSVRDPTILRILDESLAHAVQHSPAKVHIGTPEVFDLEGIEGFRFAGNRASTTIRSIEPEATEYLLLHQASQIEAADLRKDRLEAISADGLVAKKWPVFKCIQWETELDDTHYVVNDGKWYSVDPQFQSELDQRLLAATCNRLSLPEALHHEDEQTYNERAAQEIDCACADRKLVRIPQHSSPIEICDLFTVDKALIHVKIYRGSSNTSHLLGQGVVSAEALRNGDVVKEFKKVLKNKCKRLAEADVVGHPVNPREYTVVYALVVPKRFQFPQDLPVFTKIFADKNLETLEQMGYKACMVPIFRR